MKKLLLPLSLLFSLLLTAQDQVIITGLLDGTGPGAKPRAVELYVAGTVDLTDYAIERYANGGTEPTAIALSGIYTDAFVYVVNGTEEFAQAFGTAGDFANIIASGTVTGTGDDVFTLTRSGTLIDQVGGTIGEREDVYQDSYLYRNDGTGPDAAWIPANWAIPGNDVLDGKTLAEHGTIVPFGTYVATTMPTGPTVSVTGGSDVAEPATDGSFTVTLSAASNQDFTFTYRLTGTATVDEDYIDTNAGTSIIPAGATSTTLSITALDDALIEGTESIDFTFTSLTDSTYTVSGEASISVLDDDLGSAPIAIHIVQGNGDASPLVDNIVTVQAVVVGEFTEGLSGFYLQEEDADADQDSTTSEGIFVFAPDFVANVGDLLTVTATVEERFGQTQLRGADAGATIVLEASNQALPTAATLTLPRTDSQLEALEGMRVRPQDLVITDVNSLARFGEVTVTSGERLIQYTECNLPDSAGLAAYTALQAQDQLVIDDGRGGSNLTPIRLPNGDTLTADSEVRAGQTISGLTGVLGYGFNRYRVQPTLSATDVVTFSGNERPTAAPAVGGTLKVVSANVLNYFTTLGSRGADTEEELQRQEDKIVAALAELSADIVGLIEIENNDVALARLTDAVSVRTGLPYRFVISPNTGDDQIKVALIYRSDRVEESGTAAALATPASLFIGRNTNRVPLAQTFRIIDGDAGLVGEEITVCVNHLKSKGGSCGSGDDDNGGAASCNGTRTAGAVAIGEWLATKPTGVDEEDVLIIGDLNAYRMEDPIMAFLDAGYLNTKTLPGAADKFPCAGGPPSYVFGGQWGSLDYALASGSLASKIAGATAWTVNAPESPILDYNTEGSSDALFAPDFYRFSDHDPIVVGIDYASVIDKVRSSAPTDSPVELRRTGLSSYSFAGMVASGKYFVSSAAGRVLQRGRVEPVGNRFDLDGLPAGVYFVVLREPGVGQATFKLVR